MLAYLLGVRDFGQLLASPYAGAFWETAVCAELRKKLRYSTRGDLFFWRDRSKEVDFLIHHAGHFELIDAKWSEHPQAKDASSVERTASELPKNSVKRQALICRTPNPYPVSANTQAVPFDDA